MTLKEVTLNLNIKNTIFKHRTDDLERGHIKLKYKKYNLQNRTDDLERGQIKLKYKIQSTNIVLFICVFCILTFIMLSMSDNFNFISTNIKYRF